MEALRAQDEAALTDPGGPRGQGAHQGGRRAESEGAVGAHAGDAHPPAALPAGQRRAIVLLMLHRLSPLLYVLPAASSICLRWAPLGIHIACVPEVQGCNSAEAAAPSRSSAACSQDPRF